MAEFWIRFDDDGRTEGPLNTEQLKQLATRGYFGPDDEVGKALSGPWTVAGKISQLEFGTPPEQQSDSYSVAEPDPQIFDDALDSQDEQPSYEFGDQSSPTGQTLDSVSSEP